MSENVNTPTNENLGTVDTIESMPAPETMNYEETVTMTSAFVNDVVAALGELSYAETHEIIDFVRGSKNPIPINLANQLISRLASFPWKIVNNVMHNIEINQSSYFVLNTPTSQEA